MLGIELQIIQPLV